MYHMSKNNDYYIPPLDTSEVIMCPTLAFIHHSEYGIDPESGMYTSPHDAYDDNIPEKE